MKWSPLHSMTKKSSLGRWSGRQARQQAGKHSMKWKYAAVQQSAAAKNPSTLTCNRGRKIQ